MQSQSASVAEIIVVDNNCTDNTIEIAENLGVRIVKERKQNISAARNAGIRACRSEWIALLDHDDLWEKDKIKFQWKAIEKYPEARIVAANFSVFENDNEPTPAVKPSIIEESENRQSFNQIYSYFPSVEMDTFSFCVLHTSSLIIHREVFETVGMYDEAFCPREDCEFQLRALACFPLAYVNLHLSSYRWHESNTSRDTVAVKEALSRIIKQTLKHPEKYIPHSGQFMFDQAKRDFVIEARRLAQERSKINS